MTVAELKQLDKDFVYAGQVCQIMNSDAQVLRCQLRANPDMWGFRVTVRGSRVQIPRKPFLKMLGEDEE
ncbi:hypothetical protein KP626_07115 [Christensenella sp. MSJ-20]|jgi:hypothetical protein|uniref:hypothetical protein n=1 Tax=Christensenella sp. MSJ-20 TaxID=2841518 RepID=UPI001C785B06|nr:hypothetical protein KP626_07115 [Christensenella sp. MSJ-20]